jgi:hypothetical protein
MPLLYNSSKDILFQEKYRQMTIGAAETVLGFFGFDRTAYSNLKGNNGRRRKKSYEEELREQTTRDIEAEIL